MTTMPDLPSAGWGAALPVAGVLPPRASTPSPLPAPLPLEPEKLSDAARAEARRIAADRAEVQTQARTAEGLKSAVSQASAQIRPQVADLRELYERPEPARPEESRSLAEEKLGAAQRASSRIRQAAARLAAMRIANQEKAAREAQQIQADAEQLAQVNRQLTEQAGLTAARRSELRDTQTRLVDRLVEATGASVEQRADGSVDLAVGDRPLVRGAEAHLLEIARPTPSTDDDSASRDSVSTPDDPPAPADVRPDQATEPVERPTPARVEQRAPAEVADPARTDAPVAGARTDDAESATSLVEASADKATPREATPRDETPVSAETGGRVLPAESGPEAPRGVRGNPADASAPALEARWEDGSLAAVGGRLGGHLATDRTLLQPAMAGLDRVAAALSDAVAAAQDSGTTASGQPGPALLVGGSAWSLRVPDGVTAADVAAGGALPGMTGPEDGSPPAQGSAPGAGGFATPEAALSALESDTATATSALGRRAGVVGAFDVALGQASARLGQNVSAALGAVGDISSGSLVAALHRANSAMASAGLAARQAIPSGIPLLVGSSDPSVATATGTVPLQGVVGGVVNLDVLAVAGASPNGLPASGMTADVAPGDPTATVGTVAAPLTEAVSGQPLGPEGTPLGGGLTGISAGDLATGETGVPGSGAGLTGFDGVGVADPEQSGLGTPATGVPGSESAPTQAGVVPAPAVPETTAAGISAPEPGAATSLLDRTVAVAGGQQFTSATTMLSTVRPGLEISVNAPGRVTLALTPDPGPALARVQSFVDAVNQVSAAVGGSPVPSAGSAAVADSRPATGGGALAAMTSALSSMSATVSSTFTATKAAFAGPAAPAAGAQSEVSQVLAAVAAPLAATVGEAFVDAEGRPMIPGTSVHRGRVALDREVFAHEYVKDAVSVEGTIAAVARSVAATSDAASDPRIGALAVRIQSELAPQGEYSIDEASTDGRLDARRQELDRKAGALQSLLEHLEAQSGWLGTQLQ